MEYVYRCYYTKEGMMCECEESIHVWLDFPNDSLFLDWVVKNEKLHDTTLDKGQDITQEKMEARVLL